jgi:hypothetical protein
MRRRAIWTIAKTFQTNMTIFTRNTNIEMARSDGCQSLMLLIQFSGYPYSNQFLRTQPKVYQ